MGYEDRMAHPTLQGDRITLRPFAEADLPRLLDIVHEPEISVWWAGYDMARLRADVLGTPGVVSFAVELGGELIGLIMYSEETDPYYKSASIDVTLDSAHLDRGLGTEAIRTLGRYLFDVRGHHRLTIDPAASNARAVAAYRKVGFRPVGVMRQYEKGADGAYHDNLLMDMLADELR